MALKSGSGKRRNVINEYLVSLGFTVNQSQVKRFKSEITELTQLSNQLNTSLIGTIGKLSLAVVSGLAVATAGIATYVESIAKADIQTELWARRMWITKEEARSLQNTLKALGREWDEIYDIAANRELREQFLSLRREARYTEAPQELDGYLKKLREVNFEFSRLRQLFIAGGRWIAYYILGDMDVTITDLLQKLRTFNDYVRDNLPNITRKIATFLKDILSVTIALASAVSSLFTSVKNFLDRIPPMVKSTIVAIGLAIVGISNPLLGVLLLIGAILLAIEDYYVYTKGGKSVYGEFINAFDGNANPSASFYNFEAWDSFKSLLQEVLDLTINILGTIEQLFSFIGWVVNDSPIGPWLQHVVLATLEDIDKVLTRIINLFRELIAGPSEFFRIISEGDWKALFDPENLIKYDPFARTGYETENWLNSGNAYQDYQDTISADDPIFKGTKNWLNELIQNSIGSKQDEERNSSGGYGGRGTSYVDNSKVEMYNYIYTQEAEEVGYEIADKTQVIRNKASRGWTGTGKNQTGGYGGR